jgi:hypothetical protein
VDPFPHEDTVWGTLRAGLASLFFFPDIPFSDFSERHFNHTRRPLITPRRMLGIAYTIDPAHATEVRAYLGTYGRTHFSEFGGSGIPLYRRNSPRLHQTTAKRYSVPFNHSGARDAYRIIIPPCPVVQNRDSHKSVVTVPGRLYPRTCRRLRPHRRGARDGSDTRRRMLRRT